MSTTERFKEYEAELKNSLGAIGRAHIEEMGIFDNEDAPTDDAAWKDRTRGRTRRRLDILSNMLALAIRYIARISAWYVDVRERELEARQAQAAALGRLADAQERLAAVEEDARSRRG